MHRILSLSTAIMVLLTFTQCKDEIAPVPGEQTDIENLVDGEIKVSEEFMHIAPLSAAAVFETKAPCQVKVEVKGDIPVSHMYEAYNDNHSVPILGLYANTTNEVVITITNQDGAFASQTLTVITEPLPTYLPEVVIDRKAQGAMANGMHLCGLHLAGGEHFRTSPIIFDNNGDVRWVLNLFDKEEITWPVQRFSNGNIFLGNGDGIYEYSMTGELMNTWVLPGYRMHHDLIEMPNGNMLVSVQKYGTNINNGSGVVESTDDFVIEVIPANGAVVNEWDLRQVLDVDRHDYINGDGDWFHMNAVTYSEDDDCIIVSGRNQGVVKLNRNNEVVWIMSPHQGWGKAGENGDGPETTPFLLTAVNADGAAYRDEVQQGTERNDDFDWPWGQHAPLVMPNGNIFLFDNGGGRQFGGAPSNYSRAVEYDVNEGAMTIQQTWAYGRERDAELFSLIISDVDLLENGNRLMTSGSIRDESGGRAKIIELNENGSEVFEATVHFQDEGGSGEFAWGQFDIMYRSERLTLYP